MPAALTNRFCLRVLTKEGAPRFTTARVAAQAGVSVGSLYQYFPNKAAILFRLQVAGFAGDRFRQAATLPPEQRHQRRWLTSNGFSEILIIADTDVSPNKEPV
jgi:AcrR family transcriptional regulator